MGRQPPGRVSRIIARKGSKKIAPKTIVFRGNKYYVSPMGAMGRRECYRTADTMRKQDKGFYVCKSWDKKNYFLYTEWTTWG